MNARRPILTALASFCAVAGGLLFTGVPAGAAVIHEFLSQIPGVPAEGPLGEPVPLPGPFQESEGMAVDSGELYVADQALGKKGPEARLDKFSASSGAFVSQFPLYTPPLREFRQSVAVGHGTGETEVYSVGDELVEESFKGVVAVYGATGAFQGVWKGEDTPAKGFGCFGYGCRGVGGVAVDNSGNPLTKGDVYVTAQEQGVIDVFEPKVGGGEKYLTQLTGPEPEVPFKIHGLGGVAVSQFNGDVMVLDGEVVDVFEPTALEKYVLVRRLTGTPSAPFGSVLTHVAVDGRNGDIYVSGIPQEGGQIFQFNAEGVYLGGLTGGTGLRGLAVDPATGDVYLGSSVVQVFGPSIVIPDVTTEPASNVAPASARLNGTVNPDKAGEATCQFDWGTSTFFGEVAKCEPEGVVEGGSPVPVHAALGGLQPDTTYYYRLQATNKANGRTNPGESSQDRVFTTLGPGIHEESASNVAGTSATLNARINPHNAPTTYYFQYGTSASYGAETPAPPGAPIGSGEGDVEVGSRHLQGLAAGTVYHFRVVAVSEPKPGVFEVVEGEDRTFTTQPPGSAFALPDGRRWEMVSPPDKHGSPIVQPGGESGVSQASVNGNAMTYLAEAPVETEPQGYANLAQVLSRRGPGGWESADIGIPHGPGKTGHGLGAGEEFRLFSSDLSLGVVQPLGSFDPSVSAEASEQTAFLRTNYLNGDVSSPCLSCYRPLVTGKPGYANVPPGTVFGVVKYASKIEECPPEVFCGPQFVGATSDLSHMVLTSGVPLLPEVDPSLTEALYEWSGGKLTFVGDGKFGAYRASKTHAISEDGSRVIFSTVGVNGGDHFYMRDTVKKETITLDTVQGGTGAGFVLPQLTFASSDGSRVLFTDSQRLTADSGATSEEPDLYECEMVEVEGKLRCKLSDLTPLGGGEPAFVRGGVLGASEDGSYVYFVANGVLAEGAVHGTCVGISGGTCNLYVRHSGVTKLVAVVSGEDSPDWSAALEGQTARVSPDGRWLTFMSQQNLTGYVTRDAVSGKPDEEVYLYDASSGRLVCASCNPTGARPVGAESNDSAARINSLAWGGRWLAANVPGWMELELGEGIYQPRYLSDSGRVFFNSNDALVPQDVNGTWDVYEYEPPGVGNCRTSSVTYSERSGGCVDLISSGTSAEESAFQDASASGGDVFFQTAAKLAPQDFDTSIDVYDAHECTGASPCFPVVAALPPPCTTGDACKPSPTPQPALFGAPSSATFSGAGNITSGSGSQGGQPGRSVGLTRSQKLARTLRACRKKKGKSRAVCKRQARTRYAAKRSRKANNARKRGSRG